MSQDIRAPKAAQTSFSANREQYVQGISMPRYRCFWRCRREQFGASLGFAITLALMIICTTYAKARILHHQTEGVPDQTTNIIRGTGWREATNQNSGFVCRTLGTSSTGLSTWNLGFCKRVFHANTRTGRRLTGPGSHPPSCNAKCGRCVPCKPVHVPIHPGGKRPLEYYPEAWRCKCGNKLYMP